MVCVFHLIFKIASCRSREGFLSHGEHDECGRHLAAKMDKKERTFSHRSPMNLTTKSEDMPDYCGVGFSHEFGRVEQQDLRLHVDSTAMHEVQVLQASMSEQSPCCTLSLARL
jgi:hypothetical protein